MGARAHARLFVGELDQDEALTLVRLLMPDLPVAQRDAALRQIDADGDGTIDFEELKTYATICRQSSVMHESDSPSRKLRACVFSHTYRVQLVAELDGEVAAHAGGGAGGGGAR